MIFVSFSSPASSFSSVFLPPLFRELGRELRVLCDGGDLVSFSRYLAPLSLTLLFRTLFCKEKFRSRPLPTFSSFIVFELTVIFLVPLRVVTILIVLHAPLGVYTLSSQIVTLLALLAESRHGEAFRHLVGAEFRMVVCCRPLPLPPYGRPPLILVNNPPPPPV